MPPMVLFPPDLGFSEACKCPECGTKIAKLKAFEKEINARHDLITNFRDQLESNEYLCMNIRSSSHWTKRMHFLLQRKLKALSKSGVPFTLKKSPSADNLKNTDRSIGELQKKFGLISPYEEEEKPEDMDSVDHYLDTVDVLNEIDRGNFYYRHTKAKDDAYLLLEEIEKIEKKKETAVAEKLDPSISKNYIEQQVELVKKFPVEKLKLEIEGVIDEIHPLHTNWQMCHKAGDYISETWRAVSKRSPEGNDHTSNGVNQTLDLLILQFTSFEEEWQRVYANFFTPRNRANPKRQRTGLFST